MPTTTTGVATSFIDFTRASNATVTDSNGLIDWAAHNLLLASEQFDASNWTKGASSVTGNSIAAPNGSTTADTLVEDSTTANHRLIYTLVTIGARHTFGVFLKAGSRDWAYLRISDGGAVARHAYFNLSTGAIGTVETNLSAQITSVGSGWYLCTITVSDANAGSNPLVLGLTTADNSNSHAGNGTGSIHVWGAHLYRSDMGMQANTSAYPMYNPTTAKNLLGYTEDFSNAAWSKPNVTITANSVLAPNGLQTADLLTENTVNAGHWAFQSVTTTANPFTASAYFKAGTRSWAFIRITDSGSVTRHVWFDLGAGSVGTTETGITASIVSVGDGWYRCRATIAAALAGSNSIVFAMSTGNGVSSYTGDGTSGVYLWGAQLSDSASLDPYVANHFAAPSAAAYYGPRRDFDSAGVCRGLLVEEQRTNAVTYSSDFSNWSGSTATVNTNVVTAPDGTLTADEVVRATAASDHRFLAVTLTGDGSKAVSIFVKYNTAPTFSILLFDLTAVASRAEAVFTFTAGVPSATSTPAGSVEAIEPWGNGWYRIKMVATGVIAANTNRVYVYPAATGSSNGQKTTFWGAQAEVQTASFSTSLIPTIGATATRLADVAQVSTAAFPYSATEGTLVVAWQLAQLSGSPAAIHLTDVAESNRIRINAHLAGINRSTITAAGALVDNIDTSTAATGITKYAIGGKSADYAVYRNGSAGGTSTNSGFPSGCTEMRIGRDAATGNFNGHIRQITYIPRRLSNAELQARTV